MRAVRLSQIGKPLEDAEVAVPNIGASDVLIRVAACGICHSDEHYRGGISKIDRLPVTLGHEIAGWIGKHRDGGYAEFVKIPGRNAFVLPDQIPFEIGAIMMCSSATALHALNKARLKPGESIAIFGFGGLGYSALQLTEAFGCGPIYVVEINPAK